MGHSEDDAAYKIPHKMKTHWQNPLKNSLLVYLKSSIDYSHIVLIIAIWPGDRIRRPEHPTVEHGSCDESV